MSTQLMLESGSRKARYLSRYHKPWIQDEEEGNDLYFHRHAKRLWEVIDS